jgi:DNA polymerase-3 subunit gamma/tau
MSYQVIARKWRPQTFEEVTGQEAITQTLKNAIEHDRLHHAYLFSGARGVGKTTTARLLAKALNCHKTSTPNPNPCGVGDEDACVSCKEIAESRSIDVLEFDAASHTKVEEIRDIILESINVNPARDRYKVFIIDEVHMLSTSSFNALLKTLEEPPPNVAFIMATTELHKVPDTILSRCQEFEFRTIPLPKILSRLKEIAKAENVKISDDALREVARSGEGSMRDAQSNFDQVISFSGDSIAAQDVAKALGIASAETLTRVIDAISANDPAEALKVVDDLISRGHDLRNYCRDLLSFIRDILVVKTAGAAEELLETAIIDLDTLRSYSERFSVSDLVRFFNSLAETESRLREATQSRHVLEIGIVKLVEMRRLVPLQDIIERLTRLESGAGVRTAPIDPPKTDTPEKKTLKSDLPPDDAPFPVTRDPEQAQKKKIDADSAHALPPALPEDDETPGAEAREEAPAILSEEGPAPDPEPAKSRLDELRDEILRNAKVMLPPISSEELAHVDDAWLDAAFDAKLARSGDDLFPLKDAERLMIALVGDNSMAATSVVDMPEAPRRRVSIDLPDYSQEDSEPQIMPELPENPTKEQLLEYAASHPTVKRLLRTFRGSIKDVNKVS